MNHFTNKFWLKKKSAQRTIDLSMIKEDFFSIYKENLIKNKMKKRKRKNAK